MFSSLVTGHWLPASVHSLTDADAVVVIDPELPENRSVSLLRLDDGATVVSLSAERAAQIA